MTNPSRVAFTVFGREIYWYGILIAVAVLVGIYLAVKRAKRYGWKQDDLIDFALWAIPIAVVCARLYYVAFEWEYFSKDLLRIVKLWEGGLAIYGAVIGGVVTGIVFCKVRKKSFWSVADVIIPSLVLGQAIGRWGNFFNQEAFGIEVTNAAHMWFPMAVKIDATNTIHYATFFYESAWCFLIFAFLMLCGKKFKHSGDNIIYYMTFYGLERALVEGLRTDSLYIGGLRVSQVLSALLFVAGVGFLLWRFFKEKSTGKLIGKRPAFAVELGFPTEECEPPLTEGEADEKEAKGDDGAVDADETGDDYEAKASDIEEGEQEGESEVAESAEEAVVENAEETEKSDDDGAEGEADEPKEDTDAGDKPE